MPPALAIIDVETTGARPVDDRITEVAVIRVEHGREVARWASLVDPGIPIPPQIRSITGISDAMVAGAPSFASLADTLHELLADAVFVAHNARFDYGFVRNAFRRCGVAFEADVLCTVKLSRALYPGHARHGLDALIDRHGLACSARHRAMGDVEALADFLLRVVGAGDHPQLAAAVATAMKRPPRAPGLADGTLESLPASPGVYLFFGGPRPATDALLYVGSGRDLRSRVSSHFSPSGGAGLSRRVAHLEVIETAGELGATLLAAQLVARRRPACNRTTDGSAVIGLKPLRHRRKAPVLTRVPLHGTDPRDWPGDTFGVFRNERELDGTLSRLAAKHRLCLMRLGLEPAHSGACSAQTTGHCDGVCIGRESTAAHDQRLVAALAPLGLARWPWPGAIVIRERSPDGARRASHLVDGWCLLGTAEDEDSLADLLARRPPRAFDLDRYRILQRWLASDRHRETAVAID
ncbi:MAG: ethanolamine utilization protein [Rhodocyclaceae bacterium]|nr:ethanolamine utilization protein [Rhodocyclaceae bacterium]